MAASTSDVMLLPQPANVDDAPAITRVRFSAFLASLPVDRLLYPRGMTATAFSAMCLSNARTFEAGHARHFKCVTKDGQLVAFARWYVWDGDVLFPSADDDPFIFRPEPGLEPGDMNFDVAAPYYSTIDALKRKNIGGKACFYLALLATHPDFQRCGYGRSLLNHGLDLARSSGLDCCLLAAPAARPLYESLGFKEVDSVDFNLTALGGSEENGTLGMYTATLMRLKFCEMTATPMRGD